MDPTVKQYAALARAAGVARFTWNWALAEWNQRYERGEKPSAKTLKRHWNAIKGAEFPWVYDSPKGANQRPFANLQKAFNTFFKKKAKHPKFKRKGVHDSFYVENDKLSLRGDCIRLPRIGLVRLRERLRFNGKIVGAVVSRQADRWFVAIQVEIEIPKKHRTGNAIAGVDLGIKTAAVIVSDDKIEFADGPKPLKKALGHLRRLQRKVSRRKRGSNRYNKAKSRVARIHYHISNIRKDWLHKLTTRLCRENQTVVIENLNVRGMLKNHRLARAISDIGFFEFRRQFEYKGPMFGTQVRIADQWFPSSKTCHRCKAINNGLRLSDRTFRCACGWVEDRDVNAAMNLRTLGLRGNHARGEEGSGRDIRSDETILVEPRTKPCPEMDTN